MQEKALYEYAVIRVLPRVDRQEFLNVGVILYCRPQNFLEAACSLRPERLRAFSPEPAIAELKKHLDAIERICEGGENSGPIGRMSIGERFRWLTAPRSTIVQTSPVHTGLTCNAAATLEALMEKLVY